MAIPMFKSNAVLELFGVGGALLVSFNRRGSNDSIFKGVVSCVFKGRGIAIRVHTGRGFHCQTGVSLSFCRLLLSLVLSRFFASLVVSFLVIVTCVLFMLFFSYFYVFYQSFYTWFSL